MRVRTQEAWLEARAALAEPRMFLTRAGAALSCAGAAAAEKSQATVAANPSCCRLSVFSP